MTPDEENKARLYLDGTSTRSYSFRATKDLITLRRSMMLLATFNPVLARLLCVRNTRVA